jgi:hypothetical protein
MTTLMIPSFERRLLQMVREEVAAEPVHAWPPQSLQLCLDVMRKMCENTAHVCQVLEQVLADGVEARSFTRNYSPLLPTTDDHLANIRELVERLSAAEDPASESLAAVLRLLQQETKAFRDLLAEALSRASEASQPVDWGRVRAAEEAHALAASPAAPTPDDRHAPPPAATGQDAPDRAAFPRVGTPEWGRMNRRRAELIRKHIRGELTAGERDEYETLQRLSLAALEASFPRYGDGEPRDDSREASRE